MMRTEYTFDDSIVRNRGIDPSPHDNRTRWIFTDLNGEETELLVWFEPEDLVTGLRPALQGHVEAGTITQWWADRCMYLACKITQPVANT